MLANIGILVAVVVGISGILGGIITFLVKYALLPYLEKHVRTPVEEIHHQVSQNSHASETPTILDRLDDVMSQVNIRFDDVEGEVAAMIGIIVRMRSELDKIVQGNRS